LAEDEEISDLPEFNSFCDSEDVVMHDSEKKNVEKGV
jgi:hypothetical protein